MAGLISRLVSGRNKGREEPWPFMFGEVLGFDQRDLSAKRQHKTSRILSARFARSFNASRKQNRWNPAVSSSSEAFLAAQSRFRLAEQFDVLRIRRCLQTSVRQSRNDNFAHARAHHDNFVAQGEQRVEPAATADNFEAGFRFANNDFNGHGILQWHFAKHTRLEAVNCACI